MSVVPVDQQPSYGKHALCCPADHNKRRFNSKMKNCRLFFFRCNCCI